MQQRWPDRIWIVRHGESAGNVARDAAHAAGHTHIDIAERDVDVPLSPLGERQAAAVGRWFSEKPASERPDVVLVTPLVGLGSRQADYVRAARASETSQSRNKTGVRDAPFAPMRGSVPARAAAWAKRLPEPITKLSKV